VIASRDHGGVLHFGGKFMARLLRPTRKAVLWGLAGIVGLSVIGNMTGGEGTPEVAGTLSAAQSGMPTTSATPRPAAGTAAGTAAADTASAVSAGAQTLTVTRVVDGDTFDVSNGETIRVLGIDSCEDATDAGDDATSDARAVLAGAQVTLRIEPGVDRDRYGRLLRYVDVPGTGDLGEYMVPKAHTAVYEGKNDASPTYVSRLRSLDGNGRTCDEPDPAPVHVPADDDRREKAVTPDRSSNSGSDSGGGGAYYSSCKAAKAAGAAPLHSGEAGYSRKLDRDGDGTACE
jgi:micrococcal nuclease